MPRRTFALLAALAALPAALGAQRPPETPWQPPQWGEKQEVPVVGWVGGGLALALPVGEFANYVNVGGGFSGFGALPLSEDGAVSLRLDATFLLYGSETRRVPLSTTVQLVTVDVTTSNQIFGLAVGPQLSRPRGGVRPYVTAQVGFSYFATTSSVGGTHDADPFATSTNFDDFTLALRGGGGVWVRLSRGPTPVWLDLSAQYVRNGRVQYLREGSITFSGTGAPIYHPIESETHLWLVQAGVAVGLHSKGAGFHP